MMLETLFAQAIQGRTFLRMCLCGLLAGGCLHLTGWLRRRRPWLGALGEAAGVLGLCGAALWTLCRSGGGLRLYGLLGVLLGALAYRAGVQPLLEALRRACGKMMKKCLSPAGKEHPAGELPKNGSSK